MGHLGLSLMMAIASQLEADQARREAEQRAAEERERRVVADLWACCARSRLAAFWIWIAGA